MYGVVWLVSNGEPTPFLLDIINAQIGWELNGIPTAQVTLAVGREATSGLAANVHFLVDFMKMQLPFQLYITAIEFANSYGIPVETWPQGPFLVFEGYTTGAGFSKSSNGQVNYGLSLVHWLTDMNFSSCLSRTTNALSAGQLSHAVSVLGGVGVLPSFVAHTFADDFFDSANVQLDFWSLGLKPWMLRICEQDLLVDPDDPILNNQDGKVNFEARRALGRFEPFLDRAGVAQYIYGVPLQMDPIAVIGTDSAMQAIGEDVCAETFESMASTTLWDKLAGAYGPSYLFSVVPMVKTAIVVPFQPGIRGVWQTIFAEEYETISLSGDMPRALRGVRVFGGFGDQCGAFGFQQGEAADQTTIGGAFDNPVLRDGMIRYCNAPRWMSSIVSPDVFGVQAAAPNGVKGNALQPGVGVQLLGPRPGVIRQQARELLNLFAQSVYVNEITQGRVGTIRGRLRFDIGVGSSVQIMINEEKFVQRQLGQLGANFLFGSVRRITHTLDAEEPRAYTNFDVGWLRTPLENTLDGTSVDDHPLWSVQWFGSPNVDLPNFEPNHQKAAMLRWGGQ
jgi:hypothetical protein